MVLQPAFHSSRCPCCFLPGHRVAKAAQGGCCKDSSSITRSFPYSNSAVQVPMPVLSLCAMHRASACQGQRLASAIASAVPCTPASCQCQPLFFRIAPFPRATPLPSPCAFASFCATPVLSESASASHWCFALVLPASAFLYPVPWHCLEASPDLRQCRCLMQVPRALASCQRPHARSFLTAVPLPLLCPLPMHQACAIASC